MIQRRKISVSHTRPATVLKWRFLEQLRCKDCMRKITLFAISSEFFSQPPLPPDPTFDLLYFLSLHLVFPSVSVLLFLCFLFFSPAALHHISSPAALHHISPLRTFISFLIYSFYIYYSVIFLQNPAPSVSLKSMFYSALLF
jgi:hypothetical protein